MLLGSCCPELEIVPGTGDSSSSYLPLEQVGARLGVVPVEIEVEPKYVVTAGAWTSAAVKGAVRKLTANVEVVDHPTGNYVEPAAVPLADRAANAWVWFLNDQRSGKRRLAFRTVRTEQMHQMHQARLWVRVDGRTIDVPNKFGSSWADEHFTPYTNLEWLRQRFPEAMRVDLILRTNADHEEKSVMIRSMWLGEWMFRNIPLDAERQDQQQTQTPESRVPAQVLALT